MRVVHQVAVPQRERPWTNEAHVALEHVPQLRQLVQAGPTEETTDARHARVVTHLEEHVAGLVHLLQLRLGLAGVAHHGPELVAAERTLPHPDAVVREQHRSGRSDLDGDGDAEQQRAEHSQQESRERPVEHRLGDVARRARRPRDDDEQGAVQPGDVRHVLRGGEAGRDDVEGHPPLGAGLHDRAEAAVELVGIGDDDLRRAGGGEGAHEVAVGAEHVGEWLVVWCRPGVSRQEEAPDVDLGGRRERAESLHPRPAGVARTEQQRRRALVAVGQEAGERVVPGPAPQVEDEPQHPGGHVPCADRVLVDQQCEHERDDEGDDPRRENLAQVVSRETAPVQTVEPGDDDQDGDLERDLPPGQAGPQEVPRTFAHRRGDEDRRDQAAGIDHDEHGDAQRTPQRRVTEQPGQRRPRGCAHVPVYRDGADRHRLLTLGRESALILAVRSAADSFRASTVLYDERHTRPAS